MLDRFKDLFGNLLTLTKLPQAIKAGREFVELLKAGKIDEAENKAIEMLSLFLPATFTGTLDKFLDSLYATVINGIALYQMVLLLIKGTQSDPGILVMSENPASLLYLSAGVDDCLTVLEAECGRTSFNPAEGEKTENPLIIFAVIGLVIQAVDFIIKRRRERKQDGR